MRNFDRATTDKFTHHRIAGNNVVALDLRQIETGDGFQQVLHAFVSDARIEETCIGFESFRAREQSVLADEKRAQRRKIKRKATIDGVIGNATERNDAEQFAGADVM